MKYRVWSIGYKIRNTFSSIPHTPYSIRAERGFTLIEMLMVLGIMVLLSGVMLANNGRFGGQVLLQNLAYDIALSIRQAQVYGIAVERFQSVYASAYGMHFESSSPDRYILFADIVLPKNGIYECSGSGASCELVQSTKIQSGYGVSRLCATPADAAEICNLYSLDITFQRPEPDAYIRACTSSVNCSGSLYESARIEVRSPRGDLKNITVGVNGQIAVQ